MMGNDSWVKLAKTIGVDITSIGVKTADEARPGTAEGEGEELSDMAKLIREIASDYTRAGLVEDLDAVESEVTAWFQSTYGSDPDPKWLKEEIKKHFGAGLDEVFEPGTKSARRIAMAQAEKSGFFKKANSMGWGLYRLEDIDGGLGSIWFTEKDAEGNQFLVKQTGPTGDIVRGIKTVSVKTASAPPGKEKMVEELKKDPSVDNPFAVAWSQHKKEAAGKIPMYIQFIMKAAGVNETVAAELEEIMRNEIFHSTLDWQTREQFDEGARQAKELYDLGGR